MPTQHTAEFLNGLCGIIFKTITKCITTVPVKLDSVSFSLVNLIHLLSGLQIYGKLHSQFSRPFSLSQYFRVLPTEPWHFALNQPCSPPSHLLPSIFFSPSIYCFHFHFIPFFFISGIISFFRLLCLSHSLFGSSPSLQAECGIPWRIITSSSC